MTLLAGFHASGQVVINEICASNFSVIKNSNGKYDDWLELYNSGNAPVNLAGYGLTDDLSDSVRFIFPNTDLEPGGHLIVFASDSTVHELTDHYETSVSAYDLWKYTAGSAAIDTGWRNISFDDSGWNEGPGGFGKSDGDDGTVVFGTISIFIRKEFEVADTSPVLKALLMIDYDDGFIAYLNGTEIARSNMRYGDRPVWSDGASKSREATLYQGASPDSFLIDYELLRRTLRQGTNLLAIEVHDRYDATGDISCIPFFILGVRNQAGDPPLPSWFSYEEEHMNAPFKLSASGETIYLLNPAGAVIDSKTYTPGNTDHSIARRPDGSSSWCFDSTPTPGSANGSTSCYAGYASIPLFSRAGGFYSTPQTVTLTTTQPNGTIRYTTNGDIPTNSDAVCNAPISITSTTTIKARVFAPGVLPGRVITNTYIINESCRLPVFSLTTDSSNLWDYNTGIYVMGPDADPVSPFQGANFWQPWEIPAAVEYFDKAGNRVFNFNAGIEIYGNFSRAKPQKSFEIKLSDRYGTPELNFAFIPDKPHITYYENIVLRNSGTDWNRAHFRDALLEKLMAPTHTGYLASEPACLFINGEFWGVYTIHEKHNHKWIELNHELSKGEYEYLTEEGATIDPVKGTDEYFWSVYDFATTESPQSPGYYATFDSLVDIKNYTDYFIAETFYNNGDWIGDWTNNIKMWRKTSGDTKLKYLLHDLDFGLGLFGGVHENRLRKARDPVEFCKSSDIFDAVLENPEYREYFINRYADLLNTVFLPSNVEAHIKYYHDSMLHDMINHFAKWGGDTATWNTEIDNMLSFAAQRPSRLRDQIIGEFGLDDRVFLSFNVSPPGAGRIEISTVVPDQYPWAGVYFEGNPVTITAIPNPGYTFDHWISGLIPAGTQDRSLRMNFTADDAVTAYFNGSPAVPELTITEISYYPDSMMDGGDWIELHNYGNFDVDISGWSLRDGEDHHKFIFPTGTILAAGDYLVVAEDEKAFRKVYPSVSRVTGSFGFGLDSEGEMLRLFDHTDSMYLYVYYQPSTPWPPDAHGNGYTCELIQPGSDIHDGANWRTGCLGGSPGAGASSGIVAIPPVYGEQKFCAGGFTTLETTMHIGATYQWFVNNIPIQGETDYKLLATETGSYRVVINDKGCSGISESVSVSREGYGSVVDVSHGIRCGKGRVILHAYADEEIYWFDSHDGFLLGTGTEFITPELEDSHTYYARAGTLCPGNLVEVRAIIADESCEGLVSVYPNPSSAATIELAYENLEPGFAFIYVTDLSGKKLMTHSTALLPLAGRITLDVSGLEPGIYFVSLVQKDKFHSTKYLRF